MLAGEQQRGSVCALLLALADVGEAGLDWVRGQGPGQVERKSPEESTHASAG